MKTYVVVYIGALVAALFLTPLVARLSRRWRLLDLPAFRKVHSVPTPRLGGIAIFLAMMCMVIPVLSLENLVGTAFRLVEPRVVTILLAATAVFAIGLIDDLRSLSSFFKLIVVLIGAAFVCGSGTLINTFSLGKVTVQLGWMAWPVTLMWITGVTVAINFIDGLDGLAAGIAAISCGVVAALAAAYGQFVTAIIALSLLGSLTGFLFHNFHPAKIFMGDGGSMFVGFTIASASVACASQAQSVLGVLVPALALGIPIMDTGFTVFRRAILQRLPVFAAERGHIHHRLLSMGLRQRQVVLLLYAVTLASAGLGLLLSLTQTKSIVWFLFILLLPLAVFRIAGIAKLRHTLRQVGANLKILRAARACRQVFAVMRSRLAMAQSFNEWWHAVCDAADSLNLARISLALVNRGGAARELLWCRPNYDLAVHEIVRAQLPVRQRRTEDQLCCAVEVSTRESLEVAGYRMMLFSRLLEEFSLAGLPLPLRSDRVDSMIPATEPAADATEKSPHAASSNGNHNGNGHGPTTDRTALAPWSLWSKLPSLRSKSKIAPGLPVVADRGGLPARRIAIVHDFLYVYAGAERVLEQMLEVYPEADLFSLFDFVPLEKRGFMKDRPVTTSFIQRLPFASKKHRAYLPFMPLAIEQLDVSKYDLVISSSYLAAKGILTRADQLHVCYCHTPPRFAWDLQQQYLSESGLISGIKSLLARTILHYIRGWDTRTANGVDVFLTNSNYVSRRIQKIYRRSATTIYPPVDVENYTMQSEKEDFYLTMSRLVPYKRIDLIVEAFTKLPNRRLIVIGEGPEFEKIKAKAGPNVLLLGFQPHHHVKEYMQRARAFVFAAEEDFGIVPVEAQACGTPVIAYAHGGVTESVVDGRTGVFFLQQDVPSIVAAVKEFESNEVGWNPAIIRANAERFSATRFRDEFRDHVEREWLQFDTQRSSSGSSPRDSRRAKLRQAEIGMTDRSLSDQPAPAEETDGVNEIVERT